MPKKKEESLHSSLGVLMNIMMQRCDAEIANYYFEGIIILVQCL